MKLLRSIMQKRNLITALTFLIMFTSTTIGCQSHTNRKSVVKIVPTETGYQLLRNGDPYIIHGVGGTTHLDKLKEFGGNTIRTWDAEDIGPLMDQADDLGIAVVVGIWLKHLRHGHDYNDPKVRASELERVEKFVKMYRNHPALLAWGVGNEVELGSDLDLAIRQINEAASVIKSFDLDHPTMAVIAEIGDDKAVRIQDECPDIDMIGINSYGGMASVAERAKKQGYTGPYAITEFGPVGHWETGNSPWGAPYEQPSSAKASFIKSNYTRTVQANLDKNCLGSFAFLWGYKQEKTATWYGLLLESGESTESVDVLSELWTGQKPSNLAPIVTKMILEVDPSSLAAGQQIAVTLDASDPDDDLLITQWEVIAESDRESVGGDFESKIKPADSQIEVTGPVSASITLPEIAGAYRIFAIVRDGNDHAGTVNLPIYITADK
ncbi:MAG: glycoside hydrolase family 2 TIM barrel-domain containing protein [Phycisphaerales bacterium]|nr:glycoside hydrolase family 2 TIM barrel-domain containing protein [Phycisphaerales bacterium]